MTLLFYSTIWEPTVLVSDDWMWPHFGRLMQFQCIKSFWREALTIWLLKLGRAIASQLYKFWPFFYFKFGTLKIYTAYTYPFDCHYILLVVFGLKFLFQVNNLNYLMKLFIKHSQGYDRIIHTKKHFPIHFQPVSLPLYLTIPLFWLHLRTN